jgi:hypothetical protein
MMTVVSQVLQYLQAEQMDILVAGDSMMRQLYVRLVHMMRGARRVLDYHIHTPADRFRMSPVNANRSVESFKKLDLDYLEVRPACFCHLCEPAPVRPKCQPTICNDCIAK